jgi:hypothetical protein
VEYQFDDKGNSVSSTAREQTIADGISIRMVCGAAMILLGIYLGFRIANTAIGLVQGEQAPLLAKVTDEVEGKIATIEIDGKPVDFNLPPNAVKLVGYALSCMLLWVSLAFAISLLRWGSHLLKSDVAEMRQLVDSLRR